MDTKQHDFITLVIYQEKSSHCFTDNNKIVFLFTENCNNPSKKKKMVPVNYTTIPLRTELSQPGIWKDMVKWQMFLH